MLDWYDANARELPWRVPPHERKRGVKPDPYRVWLSEIMLQQTTIPHGIRYFLRFTELWPDVHALASAGRDEIMHEWAGLGYYARARNLHKCAKEVSESGGFPNNAAALQKLPGIGPYTAGAIAAIAYDEPVAAVDGNVERVLARFLALDAPLPEIKNQLKVEAASRVPLTRAGDFAQAMMDLGATICAPKKANCSECPLNSACEAAKLEVPEQYPRKAPKKAKPERHGRAYITHDGEAFLVERRPEKGLLAGMLGLPTTEWEKLSPGNVPEPAEEVNAKYIGRVEHVFTHFRLWLDVYEKKINALPDGLKQSLREAGQAGLPSVFAKAVSLWRSQ